MDGIRAMEHQFQDGNRAVAGAAPLSLGRQEPERFDSTTLLRGCAALFLFRALGTASEEAQREHLAAQLLQLISDFIPITGGRILLGGEARLRAAVAKRAPEASWLLDRVFQEGAVVDAAARYIAVPVYVRGEVAAAMILYLRAGESSHAAEHLQTLGSIATLASTALETARESPAPQAGPQRPDSGGCGLIGQSPALRRMVQMIGRVGPQDSTVLIAGETGTGKELVARALHERSPRHASPFVAINCAALTESLLESELFGHEKGAFTGAVAQKKGKLEVAEGGTVFLDEIGELAPGIQAKLLRVLEQREFERVGGTHTLRLNVRVIAATNRDLAAEVRRGAFREDLFHRLNVIALQTQPLREHREDIPALARCFLERAAAKCGKRIAGISPQAEACLIQYAWPGNVRELENAIERAVVLGESEWILPEDLPESLLGAAPAADLAGVYETSIGDAKRECILRAWKQAQGDYRAAAALLGLHPNSLLRLVRNLQLRPALDR